MPLPFGPAAASSAISADVRAALARPLAICFITVIRIVM